MTDSEVGAVSTIVGIHGIGKRQTGRHQMAPAWRAALRDGLERATGSAVAEPPLALAFYGHLFAPAATRTGTRTSTQDATRAGTGATKGPGPDPHAWLTELDGAELEDLLAAAGEAITPEEAEAAAASPAKAYTRLPRPLQTVLRALDRRFGPSAGVLYLGALREVRRYLTDTELKERIDATVRADVSPDCRVLIGHSLGSVVAFEYVRQNPGHRLDRLVTLGSPLSLRMVRRLLPNPRYGAIRGLPVTLGSWVNIRDARDPVTCGGGLRPWWPGVDDRPPVDNQGDAHAVERYLGKRETASAVLEVLPGLAP
ncbi:hypothetical protein DEJ50_01045 [Streptomyces venezuelae]|uniref:Alpha/beta hydrolase n=1 Tax=Streptomyces venezuelae TaxID=54571 RepID=A0A5P2CXD2_STRVZ|nr:hypothetical protein [Streptomyces venezuelae]QES46647.1 hypothetical protein DEJ50_01045 [Streptomyces venezuelae]